MGITRAHAEEVCENALEKLERNARTREFVRRHEAGGTEMWWKSDAEGDCTASSSPRTALPIEEIADQNSASDSSDPVAANSEGEVLDAFFDAE